MAFIEGNGRDNHLTGTNQADTILGRGGDDRIDGRGGADFIVGGRGEDRLDGGNGRDVLVADDDDRRLDGGNGQDTVRLDGDGRFDLQDVLTSVETIEQGRGNATVVLDEDALLKIDGDTLSVDLDGGRDDRLVLRVDLDDFQIKQQRDGDIVYGDDDGRPDHKLELAGVEHLIIVDTDTGDRTNYDDWLIA